MLKKVISGGQCGADQAGLKAAKDYGFRTGGWAPKGWKTKEGKRPTLLKSYGLKEHSGSYRERTFANVEDSDATIRLAINFNSPGERCTMNAIKNFSKLSLDVQLRTPQDYLIVANWITNNQIEILNIAGNSQYKSYDVFRETYRYLYRVFGLLVLN